MYLLFQVSSESERLVLFFLAQVFHNVEDLDEANLESPFDLFSHKETAYIACVRGEAVGFFTIQLEGYLFSVR